MSSDFLLWLNVVHTWGRVGDTLPKLSSDVVEEAHICSLSSIIWLVCYQQANCCRMYPFPCLRPRVQVKGTPGPKVVPMFQVGQSEHGIPYPQQWIHSGTNQNYSWTSCWNNRREDLYHPAGTLSWECLSPLVATCHPVERTTWELGQFQRQRPSEHERERDRARTMENSPSHAIFLPISLQVWNLWF